VVISEEILELNCSKISCWIGNRQVFQNTWHDNIRQFFTGTVSVKSFNEHWTW